MDSLAATDVPVPDELLGEGSSSPEPLPQPDGTDRAAREGGPAPVAPSWALTLSKGARRILVVTLVVGVVAAGLYTWFVPSRNFGRTTSTNVSASSWLTQYRGDVVSLETAVRRYQSTFDSKHPTWSALLSDCQALQNQYKVFDAVPFYPEAGPDQYLVSGVTAIYAGITGCITIIAPYKV